MKLAQSVKLGAWFFICLNIIMAFGSIWVFMRMAPAIEIIIDQNERSLEACEEMLSILLLINQPDKNAEELEAQFLSALNRADNNITEKEEPVVINAIRNNYKKAFGVNFESQKKTVSSILKLAEINRNAMVVADWKARRLGNAGAWGIVFMASALFLFGMIFIRGIKKNLLRPIEEIQSVIKVVKKGDSMRRCISPDAPQDIKIIFDGFNEILDQNSSKTLNRQNKVS